MKDRLYLHENTQMVFYVIVKSFIIDDASFRLSRLRNQTIKTTIVDRKSNERRKNIKENCMYAVHTVHQ